MVEWRWFVVGQTGSGKNRLIRDAILSARVPVTIISYEGGSLKFTRYEAPSMHTEAKDVTEEVCQTERPQHTRVLLSELSESSNFPGSLTRKEAHVYNDGVTIVEVSHYDGSRSIILDGDAREKLRAALNAEAPATVEPTTDPVEDSTTVDVAKVLREINGFPVYRWAALVRQHNRDNNILGYFDTKCAAAEAILGYLVKHSHP